MPGNTKFYESMSKQVGKGEPEDIMCVDLEIKVLEKLLFKGHVGNLVAMNVEKKHGLIGWQDEG